MRNIHSPKWATADHTVIDVIIEHDDGAAMPFSAMSSDQHGGSDIFASAVAGEYGPIADYTAPLFSPDIIQGEYRRRIAATLQNKSDSLTREALYLQNLAFHGTSLTAEQLAEVVMSNAINLWETAMIEVREALIAAQDTSTYALDATWPAPPAGLSEFLNGF